MRFGVRGYRLTGYSTEKYLYEERAIKGFPLIFTKKGTRCVTEQVHRTFDISNT